MAAKPKSKNKEPKEPEKRMRPPIVVVLGHVDHGKTKILDYIREAKVAESESGGITQHIGAYEAEHKDKKITFIDTPGHEAFSAMRSRGAGVADVAVLVVAAEESVKSQTKEAIRIIRGAGVPFVIAINKIDKPEANPEKVKQELAEQGVQVESWGGKTPSVNVSAKTGQGIDELLDTILLLAELEELTWDPSLLAEGVVIESHRASDVGNTATLLLRNGALAQRRFLAFSAGVERVKIMKDFVGHDINQAVASMPVAVSGLRALPAVGESFRAFATGEEAETFIDAMTGAKETKTTESAAETEGEDESKERGADATEAAGEQKQRAMQFPLILKSDVTGSREALDAMLGAMRYPEIEAKIIRSEVGDINESDVKFAVAARASCIAGFRVGVLPEARQLAENYRLRIITRDIIYELVDEMKKMMENALPGEIRENEIGRLAVLAIFKKDGSRQVVGGRVASGVLRKGLKCKIMRGEEPAVPCKLAGLQREKTAVDEVVKGAECGCAIDSDAKIETGDVVFLYEEEKIRRIL